MTKRFAGAIALCAAALALALAACGGTSSDSDGVASLGGGSTESASDGATTASDEDPEQARLDFAKCMREHGVDVPDPDPNGGFRIEGGGSPTDAKKFDEAQKACGDLLQNSAPQLSEEQQAALEDGFLAFAKCMREHGIDMPDPQFDGGAIKQLLPRGVNPDDPEFQDAQEACQPIMDDAQRAAGLEGQGPSTSRGGSGGPQSQGSGS